MDQIKIEDITKLSFISRPALSPDGVHAGFVTAKADAKDNDYKSFLWLFDTESRKARQLTFTGKEKSFVWEDDENLLFAAQRTEADKPEKNKKKTVYYRLNITGGEAAPAFSVPLEADAIKPLGSGKYLIEATVDLNELPEGTEESVREDEKDYHVLEEVPYWANGASYVSRLRSRLYLFDSADESLKQLTEGFFQVQDYDAKNGLLVFSGADYADKLTNYSEAWVMDLESGEKRRIVEPGQYSIGHVFLTEDLSAEEGNLQELEKGFPADCLKEKGLSLVMTMTDMIPWGSGQMNDFYRFNLSSGEMELVCRPGLSLGSSAMTDASYGGGRQMKAAGSEIYTIVQKGWRNALYRFTADNSFIEVHESDMTLQSFDTDGERILLCGARPNELGELYVLDKGEEPVKVTDMNAEYLSSHYAAKAKYVPFTDSDGVKIDGWVLEPEELKEGMCAALEIHGGPRGAYGEQFFHEMQVLAGMGFLVFYCNPRGSEGYGEEFADLRGKYGTIDYKDLMEFTDHVLKLYPQIDRKKVCALGGSYGGFMCNWIEGHTDRFAAIASQRSISNWVSDFGTSEIGVTFDENEMGANPWNGMERMWEQSPLKYADRAKTPILFIHSLCDYNCTLDQGLEMFAAMKYFGVPARMCLFEGENHSLSRSGKPKHRMRRLKEITDWFVKYTQ